MSPFQKPMYHSWESFEIIEGSLDAPEEEDGKDVSWDCLAGKDLKLFLDAGLCFQDADKEGLGKCECGRHAQ